jgi:hypothetical protein
MHHVPAAYPVLRAVLPQRFSTFPIISGAIELAGQGTAAFLSAHFKTRILYKPCSCQRARQKGNKKEREIQNFMIRKSRAAKENVGTDLTIVKKTAADAATALQKPT